MIISQVKSGELSPLPPAARPLVLAIDDQADSLLLLSCSLAHFNCEFVGKTNGSAALEVVRSRRPALILLDLVMPDITGIELTRQLRQQQLCQAVPIVAISGMSADESWDQLLAAGCSDYLGKPYRIEDLEKMVQRWGLCLS